MWSATTLAPSFSALEADVAAQLAPVRGIEWSQFRADWHRYAVSWDHRRIIDAGGRRPPLVGVGVGKRRWYATIFSFDRPRSRSISTERRGGSLSRAGFTPRSSSPWPLSCRPLVFTRADSSVFIPAVPPMFHVSGAIYDNSHRLSWARFQRAKTRLLWKCAGLTSLTSGTRYRGGWKR